MKTFFNNKSLYPWLVIGFCALFLFYKYILQVSPSVMTNQLITHFHLSGVGLGNLAAMYFYTYLIMQLFSGPLLDKYNARQLTTFAIFACAAGAVLFALSSTLIEAWLSRALIGIGAAFATVSYMKMATCYFEVKNFAFVGGLLATAAMLGSMGGEAPLAWLIAQVGWHNALLYCGLAGFAFAVLFFYFVHDKPTKTVTTKTITVNLKSFSEVLKNKNNWILMFYSGFAFSPLAVFGGLWGNPFLQTAYGLTDTQAASLTSLMFLGLAVGGPLFGLLATKGMKTLNLMITGLIIAFVSIVMVIYCHVLALWVLSILLFLFGLGTGAFMLGFSMGRTLNSVVLVATVVSLINTGDALMGALSEPLVGELLDTFKAKSQVMSNSIFSLHDFHIAFLVLPAYLLIALMLLVNLKMKKWD